MLAAARRAKYKKRVFGTASLPDNLDNLSCHGSSLLFSFLASVFLFKLSSQCQEKGILFHLDELDSSLCHKPPTTIMARLSSRSGATKPFTAWTTIFYLLLVFIAPLAFLGTAHAEEDATPQENYGTGTF